VRKDTLHKATTAIALEFKVVCMEDLNVKGMLKNHKLASAISDASFAEIKRQLQYKKQLFGGHLICIDRWFPSSKCCSHCGVVVEDLPLSVRDWKCADCGSVHDRDINASINIEKVGMANPEHSAVQQQRTHRERLALVVGNSNETNSLNCELQRSEQEHGR
jgi:putative transposase